MASWIALAALFGGVVLVVLIVLTVHRRRAKLTTATRHAAAESDANATGDIASLRAALASAEECIAQRDALVEQQAAELAEQAARLEKLKDVLAEVWRSPEQAAADYDRFKRLRTLIVMELHPDHAAKNGVDRTARTELFKAIWPKVEAITDSATV